MRKPRSLFVLMLGMLAIVGGGIVGAMGIGLWTVGDGGWRDVTSGEASAPERVPDGTGVWLRSNRDASNPLTLADGRVLYATDDPRVMVDCRDTGCVGYLQGRLDDVDVTGPLPSGWPADVGRSVRVVAIGDLGDGARRKATLAASAGLALMLVGLGLCIAWTVPRLPRNGP